MEDTDENTRSCRNCKHFVQHYIRFKTKFHETHCGHCVIRKTTKDKNRNLPLFGCERWEQAEKPDGKTTVEQIKNAIVSIQKNLASIEFILSHIKSE